MAVLSPEDRPREKLRRHGARALGDNELAALVIGTGPAGRGALAVANALLTACGGVHGLVRASQDEMARVAGIGRARAAQIAAAIELGRRSLMRAPGERQRIVKPADAARLLMPEFGARAIELFGVLLLDSRYRALRTVVVSVGTLNRTVVEPRDVFREALLGAAAAVVVFHTHPSGDPSPSVEDDALTQRLVAAGGLMGVPMVDHLILGDVRYWSYKEMKRI